MSTPYICPQFTTLSGARRIFEELIKISQSLQEALLTRVSDLEAQLAQMLREQSPLQVDRKSLSTQIKVLQTRLQLGKPYISQNHRYV